MVVRCFQCNGLLRVDENSLPPDGSARVRCPHCQGVGLMPDRSVAARIADLSSAEPRSPEEQDYPVLVPPEKTPPPQDWKEEAIPHDAFKSFRYPGERDRRPAPVIAARRGWPTWAWVVVSVVVVAFFALLVNLILPGPAGINPAIHTVPPEHAAPPGVSEENLKTDTGPSFSGTQQGR
jgi:predicted Zn finger-like uncharacterized protein